MVLLYQEPQVRSDRVLRFAVILEKFEVLLYHTVEVTAGPVSIPDLVRSVCLNPRFKRSFVGELVLFSFLLKSLNCVISCQQIKKNM